MKSLLATPFLFAGLLMSSPGFAFELMEPLALHQVLSEAFPKISSKSECYSSFTAELLKCAVNETNPADVICTATGYDSETGQLSSFDSKEAGIIHALHKADLSFLTFIEATNVSCQKNGGDPVVCRGQDETVSCSVESYMSH